MREHAGARRQKIRLFGIGSLSLVLIELNPMMNPGDSLCCRLGIYSADRSFMKVDVQMVAPLRIIQFSERRRKGNILTVLSAI